MGNGVSKKTAVVIVDHGSRRAEANALLHNVVDSFQTKSQMEIVEPAHMEIQKPSISDALRACVDQGARHIVVSPFFLSPGRHSQQDIPNLIEEAIMRFELDISYTIAEPIGKDPLIIDILQQQVNSVLTDQTAEQKA